MTERDMPSSDPQLLGGLLSLAAGGSTKWPSEELAAIWRHQLSAPLLFDLSDVAPDAGQTISGLTQAAPQRLETFADLIDHPQPPVEILQYVKEFSKTQRAGADPAFPPEVATVLYYAAIALAQVRMNRRITELDRTALLAGLRWAEKLPWIDEKTRSVLAQAAEKP